MNTDEINNDKPATEENPQPPKPPFKPEELQKEFQDLIQKKFGGQVQVISMGQEPPFEDLDVDEMSEESSSTEDFKTQTLNEFNYKPKEVKAYLDRFVIGQDDAKVALSIAICDHYNHLKDEMVEGEKANHYQKQNVLVLGPTGVGKTYLVQLISQLIGVPFVKADATRFSEVGYMGANVDDIIRDLVQKAGGNKHLASKGIVYVDEIDKLASKDSNSRDVSGKGVQFGFLRLLENSDVDLNSSHDMASQFKTFMNFQKKGKAEKEIVNTRDILFIFSGAFHGLETIIKERLNKKAVGIHSDKKSETNEELFKQACSEDLVKFGFEHEFIGRLPIRVSCDSLSKEDLYKILKESEHSIVNQYVRSFKLYGIDLKFTEASLKLLAEKAFEQKTGARALNAVFEETLRIFKFELPSTGITQLEVNEDLINNPRGYLYHLITN